tara:strand:- start:254 stop:430 length:177 start_codon:yes stop_codon:yes gene_type:complete
MLPYHIRARDMSIHKPKGKVIQFWLGADSREHLDEILKEKTEITQIEWIRQENFDWKK